MSGAVAATSASQAAGSSRKRRSPPPEGESGEFDVRAALALTSPPGANGAAPPALRLSGATFYTPSAPTPEDAAAAVHAVQGATVAVAVAAPQPPRHRTRRHVTFAEAPAPPAALPLPAAARLWSYEDASGRCFGPATAAALAEALKAGDVAADALVHAVTGEGGEEGASMPLRLLIGLSHSPQRAPAAPALQRAGSVAAAYARKAAVAQQQQLQVQPVPGGGGDPLITEGSAPKWRYRDPSGAVQGPFARSQLATWLTQRFLPPELRLWRDDGAAPRGTSAAASEAEALSLEHLVRHGTPPPPARATEAAARKAMKQALKQAVADAAKKALQPRYATGTLDRERFKECVAATVAKVEKATEARGLQQRWRSGADAAAWVAEPSECMRIQDWANARADRVTSAATAAAATAASPADEL